MLPGWETLREEEEVLREAPDDLRNWGLRVEGGEGARRNRPGVGLEERMEPLMIGRDTLA